VLDFLSVDPVYYLPLRLIHILSSTLLFGNGLGAAFHGLAAFITKDPRVIAKVGRSVVWLQIRIRQIAEVSLQNNTSLPPQAFRYIRIWFALGWPAFAAVLGIFYLMVFRPAL
jgi:uncharacterized membrane protein